MVDILIIGSKWLSRLQEKILVPILVATSIAVKSMVIGSMATRLQEYTIKELFYYYIGIGVSKR